MQLERGEETQHRCNKNIQEIRRTISRHVYSVLTICR